MNKQTYFDQYLSHLINEHELVFNLDTLQSKMSKEGGVIYTPIAIVENMIELANPNLESTIIEPSCGHGSFVFGLLNHMRSKFELDGNQLFNWFQNKLCSVEISEDTVKELKEMLALYFLKHFGLEVQPSSFTNIFQSDSLNFKINKPFDLCIGNPPYVRAKHLDSDYLIFLKNNFKSCAKGTIDLYFAFIEKYLHESKELVFITPNSFLTSNAGSNLREQLTTRLDTLIDFKEKLLFPDARVYTCIFKTSTAYSKYLNYGHDFNSLSLIPKILLKPKPYQKKQQHRILSGIATLADSVYQVTKIDGAFFASYEGNLFEIEKEILAPYLKLTKTYKKDFLLDQNYMIFPYHKDKSIISEDNLKTQFPKTYAYLSIRKARLMQRDKGKTSKYESWYAYGRKQGIHNINSTTVMAIPQMIGGNCLPHILDLSSLLSEFCNIVFTSGFLILLDENDEFLFNELQSSSFRDFLRKEGKPFPGKAEPYYSLNIKQIQKFISN